MYYEYCLVIVWSVLHLVQSTVLDPELYSTLKGFTTTTKARQTMTMWYCKSMTVGSTSYYSSTKEAKQRPIKGHQRFHKELHCQSMAMGVGG